MLKVVFKDNPTEKVLVSDYAFKCIIINDDKTINPIIVWSDNTRTELLRFWTNDPVANPQVIKKKIESSRRA